MIACQAGDRLWYLPPDDRSRVAVVVEAVAGAALYIKRQDGKPMQRTINGRPGLGAVAAIVHGDYWRLAPRA